MEIIRRPDKSRNDRFKVFNNENLGSVRTFNIEGEPWFCLKDVCEILEIGNPSDLTPSPFLASGGSIVYVA